MLLVKKQETEIVCMMVYGVGEHNYVKKLVSFEFCTDSLYIICLHVLPSISDYSLILSVQIWRYQKSM